MQGYGLKISKANKDVTTATGRDLIYSSENEYLFIQKEGVIRTGENHEVPHGLSYYPTGIVWADDDANWFYKAFWGDPNASVLVFVGLDSEIIRVLHGGSDVGDEAYYMVFNNPSNI